MPSAGIKMVAVVLSSGTKAASIISLFESIPTDLGTAWILKIDRWPSLGEPFPTYLSRRSQNPVCVWKQPQELCANTITIIPPEYNLVISQGSLVEAADMMNSSAEDMLLSSAAHEFGDRSVAVVLAGARTAFPGLRCVRNAGGLVLAEPVEAVNASIPLESISEHIDFWIPVQYIPATLMKTNRRSQDMPDPEDHGPWDQAERELVPVFRRLLKLTGIDFSSYKLPTILRRTLRRMELKNFAAISDYARLIEADEQEAKALAKDFLIQVTQFFRDPEAFLHLQEKILPNVLLQTEEVKGIRIWVPACGTGQEVYSLAIIVEELRRSLPVKPPIRIFATDVDDQAIAAARSGIYAPHELTDLSADRIDEFFEKLPNGFSVSASIRDMVTFLPHNLLRDAPFVSLDLVCCRNFLIYLRPDVQRRVLSAFQMGLNLNGILVLGASEHLGDEQTGFEVLSAKWKIFRKVQNAVRFLQLPFNLEHRHPSAAPLEEPIIMRETQQLFAINKAYDDLLSFVGSTGFLFRRNGGLIHIFGEGHKYIQTHPGRWDENLLKLVHPELSLAISNALLTLKDRDNDGDLRISGVPVQFPAPDSTVSITLRKLKADPFEPVYAILLQPDSPAAAERSRTDIDFEHKDQAMKRISQLEFELEQVQSHLRSTIEQLEVSNEELVSTNEEMQGTNEELQASIEELRVANHEHKTTLHRITELHNDLQNLVRRSDVGQIFLARDHTIRLCTPRAVSYISLLPQDVGRPLEHLTLKFDFPSLFAEINNVLADSEMQEYELQTHGGEWFRLRMSPFYGQTNECEGVVLSFVDIHRIKLAEERFRRLLVYSPDAMVVCSPSGEIMLVNEQTKRLFGYSARELEGRPVEILIPERFREAYPMHRASYMEKPSVRPMGTRAALYGIRADGSEVPIEVSLGTIEAEEGLLVVATFRDVTEFRFLETLQKNSNLILEQVVRGDPFEMVLTALVINVEQSCFGALCCVLSFEKDRRCLKTLVAPHLPEEYLQTINELRVGDGGDAFRELASAVKSVELADYAQHPANGNSCETSGGADRQTFSWVEPIVDTGGTRLGLFCMFPSEERELTQREHEIVNSAVFLAGIVMERRTREERMRQREEDLRHAHRLEAFGELAGGVAHEFNNLLQAIRGYIEFALETLPDETSVAGDLQMVNRAVERGMTLTRELLSLGRRQPLQRIYVDPAEFLEGTVKLLRPLLGNVIAVEQIVGEHLGTVHLDVAQFQQAILNLCINSRDAMPEGGTIAISLERIELDQKHGDTRHNFQIGRHLLMKITDTGTGIDPDVMERIFEPFFTTKEVGKGTGLGMPMVYSMVTQHGGGIYVESEPGSGTTVSIYLPAYDMPPTIRVEKELVVSVSGNGETILVAEDDALVAVMIQRILDRANYRVLLVQDGIEALEVFERHESEIDAAILDIIMPRLGGHAVAAKIRRRNPQLPIIFSTGYNPHSATVGRVADLKENLITKPYEPLTLLSLLRKVLDEKRTDTV